MMDYRFTCQGWTIRRVVPLSDAQRTRTSCRGHVGTGSATCICSETGGTAGSPSRWRSTRLITAGPSPSTTTPLSQMAFGTASTTAPDASLLPMRPRPPETVYCQRCRAEKEQCFLLVCLNYGFDTMPYLCNLVYETVWEFIHCGWS